MKWEFLIINPVSDYYNSVKNQVIIRIMEE